jgi:hypothetical protein
MAASRLAELTELYRSLPPEWARWAPASRSITKPIPLGGAHDLTEYALTMYGREGARMLLVAGMKGSGKGNTSANLLLGITQCRDTLVWGSDIGKKGIGLAPWMPCLDWLAITRKTTLHMLTAAEAVIAARAQDRARRIAAGERGVKDKHTPTAAAPHITILMDEASDALAGDDEVCWAICEKATNVARKGRSEAVSLGVMTQRPKADALGPEGSTLRSQLDTGICLRMRSKTDVGFVFPEHVDDVDLALFDVPGVFLIQDGPKLSPVPVRSYALYEPDLVREVAEVMALPYTLGILPEKRLEPLALAAAGTAYAARSIPFATTPTPAVPEPATTTSTTDEREVITMSTSTPAPSDVAAAVMAKNNATTAIAQARATVAEMEAAPTAPAVPLGQLADQHVIVELDPEPGDDLVDAAILAALRQSGGGLSSSELAELVDRHRSTVSRRLSALQRSGRARCTGRGPAMRWSLTEAA